MQTQTWRKSTAIVAVTAMVASGFSSSSAFAQTPIIRASDAPTARVDQAVPADHAALIAATIQRYPNGGEPLKLAISDLIIKHPKLGPSIAMIIRNNPSLTRAQKQAIFDGLAEALGRLGIVAADLPIPMATKAQPGPAVVAPVEGGIDPLVIALLLAAAAGAAVGGCALAGCFSHGAGPAPVPVPSPN
jgi:hypothetical protein